MRLITWLEIIGLGILLDDNLTIKVKGNVFTNILGQASMILYIWHMVPIVVVQQLFMGWSLERRSFFVFFGQAIGTIILLLVSYYIDYKKGKFRMENNYDNGK